VAPDSQSRIDIRCVDELRRGRRRIRILIDGKRAGEMDAPYQEEQLCSVAPGSYAVSLRWWFWRSKTVQVNIAPGEIVKLECGFERPKPIAYAVLAISSLAAHPFSMAGLPNTGFTAFLFGFLGFGYVGWRNWMTAGGYLFLRPRAEKELPDFLKARPGGYLPDAICRSDWQRPRITIQQSMFLVAAIACLLAVATRELRMQHELPIEFKQELYRIKQDGNRAMAKKQSMEAAERPFEPGESSIGWPDHSGAVGCERADSAIQTARVQRNRAGCAPCGAYRPTVSCNGCSRPTPAFSSHL
jgi:hypothetical protein